MEKSTASNQNGVDEPPPGKVVRRRLKDRTSEIIDTDSNSLDSIKVKSSSSNISNQEKYGEDIINSEGNVLNDNGLDQNTSASFFGFIKSIIFQICWVISLIYKSYMFITDPFGIMRRVKSYLIGKVIRTVYEWLKERDAFWKVGIKCGFGILWLVYVSTVFIGFVVLAFLMGGLVVRAVVVEPLRIKEVLSFDYSHKAPVAHVPLTLHSRYKEDVEHIGGRRVIPPNRKLQVTVSLKLPESDYNRNLGVFQVRVDLLTADGRTLASSRQPCMLQFKSDIIRSLLTFLNVAPLITGYASESQTININFKGFNEGSMPTASLRVIIEQRAEFEPGGGIPEIYAASLTAESELPLLKRVMWYWKKTFFVWISMTLFIVELFLALLCCKPLVIPRIKLRGNSANPNAADVNPRVRR